MDRTRKIYQITIVGSVVNLLLTAFKLLAGSLGHSGAMVADGVHSLSDLISDFIVLVFVKISGRPSDRSHRYGYGKFETFATFFIGALLLIVGFNLLKNGVIDIIRVCRGEILPAPGYIALAAALLSIVSKEILFRITYKVGEQENSQAVKANAWHHRSDALSSVATAVGIGGAILFGVKGRVLDPVAAVLVSAFIVRAAGKILIQSFNELMDCSLPKEVEDEIVAVSDAIEGVSDTHHLYTRRIGNSYAIEVHARMDGRLTLNQAHDKASEIERALKAKYGPETHVTVHVEPTK